MKKPEIPENEAERQAVLERSNLVYSTHEERFDRITRLARRSFNVPIALISLVSDNIQWFKSCQGLPVSETSREVSFCGHAILQDETLVIPDTYKNSDYADNPLVLNEPHIRFYAGHPIRLGIVKLGTLCIIDIRPRRLRPDDIDALKSMALWVENELKLSLYTQAQKDLMAKVGSLQRKSMIDADTGCWNKRGMDELFSREVSRAHDNNEAITLMLINVEIVPKQEGKSANETNKTIIKEVVQRIRMTIRPHDVIAKVDDNKVFVLLTNCNQTIAETLTQRILKNMFIDKFYIKKYKSYDTSVSPVLTIGVCSNDEADQWSTKALNDTVEKALSYAKQNGLENNYYFLKPDFDN
jgi:diguanylate cyclase (GGDEF)-like protein